MFSKMPSTLFRSTWWSFLYVCRFSSVTAFSLSTSTKSQTLISVSSTSSSIFGGLNTFPNTPSFNIHRQRLPINVASLKPATTRCFTSFSDEYGTTTSANFAMDPYSEEARDITKSLGISEDHHEKLTQLANLVVEWNERLNLISRKDCNLEVVFGRHILPSIALAGLPHFQNIKSSSSGARIVDVGTGGGFPGLPLSIIFPEANFLLVDSVGKKLKAIDEMAAELNLENISTHHGRVEQIVDDPVMGRKHRGKYDICVGRSVTAMPRFCFWIQGLLKKDEGRLVYIIGGEVEKIVQSRVESDVPIDTLLDCEGASDKRALILNSQDVIAVARLSGEKKIITRSSGTRNKSTNSNNNNNKKMKQNDRGEWSKSKGGWKRDNEEKKDRGYSNFKRYEIE